MDKNTTMDKNRTTANKRSRYAAIRNEASTVGTTVRNVDWCVDWCVDWNVDWNVDFDR